MPNNFTIEDNLERIYLNLPSKFTRDNTSVVYALISGLAAALKINTDVIDELFRQTNFDSSSGSYVDNYINGLIDLGRQDSESDDDYKFRYNQLMFTYNCTKPGMEQVVIDIMGKRPYKMYNGNVLGAYLNGRYYYTDSPGLSFYGDSTDAAFTGIIEFARKPNSLIFDQLCITLAKCKAEGINIFLKYPLANQTVVDLTSAIYERITIS